MAVGDIYVVKMFQEQFLESILNVFYYRQLTQIASENANGLFEGFDAAILANWAGCVIASISVINLEIFQPLVPTDFIDGVPTNNVGLRPDISLDRLPTFIAFSYKSNRFGAGSRASFKRFAGLEEADINANSMSPAFLALAPVIALQAALGNAVASVAGSTYVPIQVKSGWKVGFAPVENFILTTWAVPTLSSQVSRKPS